MIPTLTDAGYRVIAPDMIGFGKSDKYISTEMYSHQLHVNTMHELIKKLDLTDITAHFHDWGGLVGLRFVAEDPDRFTRIIASNTGLPAMGRGIKNDMKSYFALPLFKLSIWLQGPATWEDFVGGDGFTNWIRYSKYTDNIDVGAIMQTLGSVSDIEKLAFREVFESWNKPFLIANSDNDPVTGNNPELAEGLKRIPSAQEIIIYGPGHFIQEEAGPEYAQLIIDFINGKPKGFTVDQRVISKEDIL
jgi:haloalkane dehalogenase